MANVPLFSIILPTYNRVELLKVAIASVLAQSYQNFELIIVDDGSTDSTKEVVSGIKDERVRYFFQKNQERSIARNHGIDLAKGKYICFLDDDDYYMPDFLSTFYDDLAQKGFPDIILRTGFIQIENGREVGRSDFFNRIKDVNPTCFCAYHFCAVVTMCIPKVFLKDVKFPIAFRHWQDTHLILRLLALYPFRQLDVHTYAYIQHPQMGSRSIYHFSDAKERIQSNVEAMFHVFREYGGVIGPYLSDDTLDYLVSEKYLNHANGALKYGKVKLASQIIKKSLKYSKGRWFRALYLKFYMKIPLKIIFGYPRY